jgi:hypothetical protein
MDAAKDYPTQVGPTIHPEIWAPRLYAKGLNTLELSSGRVAVTTNDKHALDIQVLEHPLITIIHISTSRTMVLRLRRSYKTYWLHYQAQKRRGSTTRF